MLGALDDKIAANTKLAAAGDELLATRFESIVNAQTPFVRLSEIADVNRSTLKPSLEASSGTWTSPQSEWVLTSTHQLLHGTAHRHEPAGLSAEGTRFGRQCDQIGDPMRLTSPMIHYW